MYRNSLTILLRRNLFRKKEPCQVGPVVNDVFIVMYAQWREASYSDSHGDVFRVYTVCNVAVMAVDNWLLTPYIGSSPGNRLYVDVTFSMRKCTKYPNPARLQQCKVGLHYSILFTDIIIIARFKHSTVRAYRYRIIIIIMFNVMIITMRHPVQRLRQRTVFSSNIASLKPFV